LYISGRVLLNNIRQIFSLLCFSGPEDKGLKEVAAVGEVCYKLLLLAWMGLLLPWKGMLLLR
jgi:hypothetical protein